MAKVTSSVRFPNESPAYRKARDKLLEAEIALRKKVEDVAALRRKLPAGGEVKEDYVFDELPSGARKAQQVALSQLFQKGKNSLIVYSYMFAPRAKAPCPMCTSMLDSLDRTAPHAMQRVNLVVVAKSPIENVRGLAKSRGWQHLRLLSSAHNSYNRDYHGETADGDQMPSLNVFRREGGVIRHTYHTELLFTELDGHPRHVDLIWPLWNLFDLTPEGRGETWYPALEYK
jgi:predicted dithiol-disulfide oxidoreductase (DUF899 family)